jgi:uncharacterized protein YndB with AHSA1/START domain
MPTQTESKNLELKVRRTIDAPRQRVFEAWTDPKLFTQWFFSGTSSCGNSGLTAELDARAGGRYHISMTNPKGEHHSVRGEYKEVRPPERLVFTWIWEKKAGLVGEGLETLVTVDLIDRNGKTEVVLTHQRFVNEEAVQKHTDGWNGCLEGLEKFLAQK